MACVVQVRCCPWVWCFQGYCCVHLCHGTVPLLARKLCTDMMTFFFSDCIFFFPWRGRETQEKGKSDAPWTLAGTPHHHLNSAAVSIHRQWEQRRDQHLLELLHKWDAVKGGGPENRSGSREWYCGNLSAPRRDSAWPSCECPPAIGIDDHRLSQRSEVILEKKNWINTWS